MARNVRRLGAQAPLVGVVGDDEPGRRFETLAREAEIDRRLVHDPALPTTIKLRVIGRQQQLLRIDFEAAREPDRLEDKFAAFREQLARA